MVNLGPSSTCPDNMVNLGPLTAEIGSGVWAPLQISTGFASRQRYCTASSSGRQPNFAALNRGRHLRSAGRPSGWALAHILVNKFFSDCRYMPQLRRHSPTKLWDGAQMAIFASFLCPLFSASHVHHISDLQSKFALRPHHVWKYGRHPISDRWN